MGYDQYISSENHNILMIISTALVDGLPTKFARFNWWTEYSDKNFTETDALWDDISEFPATTKEYGDTKRETDPAHGFIAVDREWAMAQHWPKSMHLPSDSSKNVYLLEEYHLMHCIVSPECWYSCIETTI